MLFIILSRSCSFLWCLFLKLCFQTAQKLIDNTCYLSATPQLHPLPSPSQHARKLSRHASLATAYAPLTKTASKLIDNICYLSATPQLHYLRRPHGTRASCLDTQALATAYPPPAKIAPKMIDNTCYLIHHTPVAPLIHPPRHAHKLS